MIFATLLAKAILPVFAQATSCSNSFFGFPTWWKYLNPQPSPPSCQINLDNFSLNDIWSIALAVVDMLLYIAGIVAVVSIIIAGIMYVTSIGNAEKATSARKRIQNALIGLAIVIIASAVVSFIGNNIG